MQSQYSVEKVAQTVVDALKEVHLKFPKAARKKKSKKSKSSRDRTEL